MSYVTLNTMLRRTAWRLPDRTFITWTDHDRSMTYAQIGLEHSPASGEILTAMPMTPTGKIGRAEQQRRERR